MFWNKNKEKSLQKPKPSNASAPVTSRFSSSLMQKPQALTASPNATEEIFSIQMIDPIAQGSSNTWSYTIPILSPNQKKLILSIQDGEFFVLSVPTATFPKELHVCCNQISGFCDNQGIETHKIAILRLRQIVPVVESSITTYTLVYSVLSQAVWDLGLQRTLTFYMSDQTGVWAPPYATGVFLQFKIVHVAY